RDARRELSILANSGWRRGAGDRGGRRREIAFGPFNRAPGRRVEADDVVNISGIIDRAGQQDHKNREQQPQLDRSAAVLAPNQPGHMPHQRQIDDPQHGDRFGQSYHSANAVWFCTVGGTTFVQVSSLYTRLVVIAVPFSVVTAPKVTSLATSTVQ